MALIEDFYWAFGKQLRWDIVDMSCRWWRCIWKVFLAPTASPSPGLPDALACQDCPDVSYHYTGKCNPTWVLCRRRIKFPVGFYNVETYPSFPHIVHLVFCLQCQNRLWNWSKCFLCPGIIKDQARRQSDVNHHFIRPTLHKVCIVRTANFVKCRISADST